MKGLGSGRGAARQGFAAALTALLESASEKDTADVFELADKHLSLTGVKGTVCYAPDIEGPMPASAGSLEKSKSDALSQSDILLVVQHKSIGTHGAP